MSDDKLTKRDKFVTLAEKRVIKTIRDIRLIGKLSNKSHYEYNEEDIKKIVQTLSKEIHDLRNKFLSPRTRRVIHFKLDSSDE